MRQLLGNTHVVGRVFYFELTVRPKRAIIHSCSNIVGVDGEVAQVFSCGQSVDNILGGMQKNADKVIHSLSTPLRKCRKQSYPQTYPHNINELTKRVWAGSLPPLYYNILWFEPPNYFR